VDFRKGMDGLAALCRQRLLSNPMTGTVFVFRNKRRDALKILTYDGQGFWLCTKRLSTGRFKWWPQVNNQATHPLIARELSVLLWNGNPAQAALAPDWRKIAC
jgi:transposase